ncbi:hypothetical protein K1719_023475 [Acacia pycnantha]|nr:hypothetical protein K1719_023475 [Acacia pycnantha]
MSAEDECKGRKNAERYEILPESVKKNNELDHENTLSELRIKNAKLEEEKCLAESAAEFWKSKFEELSERLLMVEKGVNSFMNGDAHVGIGGKAEDLSCIQGNTHPGVSGEVMDEKDMNVNNICDNEQVNTTAGSSPSQREDLKSGNTHVSTAEVTRLSPDSPNKALLGASGISTKEMDKQEDNEVYMDDHECGNITADNSPSQTNSDDCRNAHLAVDDDNRQSPDTPITTGPGASANASLGSRQVVVEVLDSDDDDECIASGTLNGKEASCDIAPAVDDIGRSSVSGLFESLKRKWFPEGGNSFDGLNKNLVDVSDTDDDSSSSTSFSLSGINKIQLPPDFLCSTGGKRRKT